jgi:hypothetical protein
MMFAELRKRVANNGAPTHLHSFLPEKPFAQVTADHYASRTNDTDRDRVLLPFAGSPEATGTVP